MLAAQYMLSSGAASLILLGRSGRCADVADMRLLADEQSTARVTLLRADVSGRSEAANAMSAAHDGPERLGGVLHAAGLQASSPPLPPDFAQGICSCLSKGYPKKYLKMASPAREMAL